MAGTISRRSFLKKSSIAGLTAAVAPAATTLAKSSSSAKSRVVLVTDPDCYASGSTNQERIQAMMDHAVMFLTDKTEVGAAYEALFPKGVTSSTKILMKRNDFSGAAGDFNPVDKIVTAAFQTGCKNMLGGSFPTGNVTIRCKSGTAKSDIEGHNYLINSPVCSCHSGYGVTLSLKNTMTYLGVASSYHSADKKWLHEVSMNSLIKEKQVISIMNAVVGNNKTGPMANPNIAPKTLILSKDIVAVDYCAMRIMEEYPATLNKSNISSGDSQLKAAETAGLGTCTPSKMEVIKISPANWNTGLIQEYNPLIKRLDVRIIDRGGFMEFVLPSGIAQYAKMVVFDMRGGLVWKTQSLNQHTLVWHKQSTFGGRVPKGMYTYRIVQEDRQVSGILMITR
ncbi:MAG: DUF362 domain-containing protein [Chitinispirillaceae bacterium]|nr:DUF362 domain-containing protein [Chitinispirillaceae bacterium]